MENTREMEDIDFQIISKTDTPKISESTLIASGKQKHTLSGTVSSNGMLVEKGVHSSLLSSPCSTVPSPRCAYIESDWRSSSEDSITYAQLDKKKGSEYSNTMLTDSNYKDIYRRNDEELECNKKNNCAYVDASSKREIPVACQYETKLDELPTNNLQIPLGNDIVENHSILNHIQLESSSAESIEKWNETGIAKLVLNNKTDTSEINHNCNQENSKYSNSFEDTNKDIQTRETSNQQESNIATNVSFESLRKRVTQPKRTTPCAVLSNAERPLKRARAKCSERDSNELNEGYFSATTNHKRFDDKALLSQLDALRCASHDKRDLEAYKREKAKIADAFARRAKEFPAVSGVYFDRYQQRWSVNWNENGRRIAKYFPVKTYGFDVAHRFAIQCKAQQRFPAEALDMIEIAAQRDSVAQSREKRRVEAQKLDIACIEKQNIPYAKTRNTDFPTEGIELTACENDKTEDNLHDNDSYFGPGQREHVAGVHFDRMQRRWKATWYTQDGKRHAKYFPVKSYGFEEAKNLATKCRLTQNKQKSETETEGTYFQITENCCKLNRKSGLLYKIFEGGKEAVQSKTYNESDTPAIVNNSEGEVEVCLSSLLLSTDTPQAESASQQRTKNEVAPEQICTEGSDDSRQCGKKITYRASKEIIKQALAMPRVPGVWFDKVQCRWACNFIEKKKRKAKYFPVKDYGINNGRRLAIATRLAYDKQNIKAEQQIPCEEFMNAPYNDFPNSDSNSEWTGESFAPEKHEAKKLLSPFTLEMFDSETFQQLLSLQKCAVLNILRDIRNLLTT
ncbi:AP2 domain transcription factor AP2IX-3 [Cardiosporidium cionae]|uniref:AP2 domain transcription factor AP2IX-3 n=1 Tax=Cardiosporidium cionae TaxID=476202 RepID=A0ABQ7JEP9_9APIC|nr:AP2 domain transcription factor AP2IX-3 [Cardiosporidium cionae]|eukprot:KAF8822130.1 AP2 domain transcription factor AP2IX-3 [Cardiosporidium cionae]